MAAEEKQLVGSKSGSQEPRKEARTVMQAGGNGGSDWCSSSRGCSCLEMASPVSPDCLDIRGEGREGRTDEICLRCECQVEMGSQEGKSVQVQMLSFASVPLGLRGQAEVWAGGVGRRMGGIRLAAVLNSGSLGTHRNLGPRAILATSPAGNRWAMI